MLFVWQYTQQSQLSFPVVVLIVIHTYCHSLVICTSNTQQSQHLVNCASNVISN